METYDIKTNDVTLKIFNLLLKYKHLKSDEIANKLNISERTARTHIHYLMRYDSHIVIKRGKYNGGVYYEND